MLFRSTAKDVRVEYTLMVPFNSSDPATPSFYARSQDPRNEEEYAVVFTQAAIKDFIGPHEVVGLPIPRGFGSEITFRSRFGMNLHIEWFTEKGSPQKENIFVADIGVMMSGYDMPEVTSLRQRSSGEWEAVTPVKTPEDYEREHREEQRREAIADAESA